jgi:hypothetical protein
MHPRRSGCRNTREHRLAHPDRHGHPAGTGRPPLSPLSARRIRRHPHLARQDRESPPIPRQCNTGYTLDVHHAYTICTISVHHPYAMRTISVHDPYTMRTPSQFQMRWPVIRLLRRLMAGMPGPSPKISGGSRKVLSYNDLRDSTALSSVRKRGNAIRMAPIRCFSAHPWLIQ